MPVSKKRNGTDNPPAVNKRQRGQIRTREQLYEAARQQAEALPEEIVRVIPFKQWCVIRGISEAVAHRLVKKGKLRITRLSERRIGVRTDDDRAYLDACASEVTS